MKKLLFALVLMAMGSTLQAQTIKDELAQIQELWGKDKKAVVNEALKLSTEDAGKFWPLYDEYQVTRKQLGQDRLAAIQMYADNYETMTNDKATEIATAFLKNNASLNKLQSQYLKKISKAVSPIKAVQFLQLESYIDSQLRAAVSDALPFMPDVKH
jgi:hypothetical protein